MTVYPYLPQAHVAMTSAKTHRGRDLIGAEYLHQPQNLDELALALLTHSRFQKTPQRGELLRHRQPASGAAWSSALIFCSISAR